MKLTKTHACVLSSLFLLLLLSPLCVRLPGAARTTTAAENRETAPQPEAALALESFPEFTRQFARYYDDSFGLRNQLIRWNNLLRLRLFRESPVKGVRVGRAGWLFYADEWACEDYENVMPYQPADLQKITTILEQRRAWLARRGIKFVIVVAPNTHTIYPEYLPPYIRKLGDRSRLDQVTEHLRANPDIELLDLRAALLQSKPWQRLYHRTDTHWNDYGSFVGYRQLVDRIDSHFPHVKKLGLEDFTVTLERGDGGDLARLLSLADVIQEERILLTPKFAPKAMEVPLPYPDPVTFPGRKTLAKQTGDHSLPKAVVFRDSYAWGLIPYLSESFERVVYVWTFSFLPELIEREKPDIVILECVERYLNALLVDNPDEVASQR